MLDHNCMRRNASVNVVLKSWRRVDEAQTALVLWDFHVELPPNCV